MPWSSGRFAVRMATIMLTMSGMVASRVRRPTTISDPQIRSLYETSTA